MLLRARIPASLTALPNRAGTPCRAFSIQGQQAAALLSERLQVPVTAHPPSKSQGLAVLMHADRRPQPYRGSTTFFGPSLVVKNLSPHKAARRSDVGDIGLLNLTQARLMGKNDQGKYKRNRVAQTAFSADRSGVDRKYIDRILARAQLKDTLADGGHREAVSLVLQRLTKLFADGEGIYFTLFVHDAGEDGISISLPYLEFDDYAVHRMPEELQALHKAQEREPNAAQAMDGGLFYIKLHNGGNVGSFGYGAGNAMATMDGLTLAGGKPANFLDGGGGANRENARLAIETLNRDPDVKSIFVNTFGGITQTDVVADGIIDAIRANNMKQPVVVRVMGTGSEEAKRKLRESGLAITIEDDFKKAARLAVEQAERASASASASASQE